MDIFFIKLIILVLRWDSNPRVLRLLVFRTSPINQTLAPLRTRGEIRTLTVRFLRPLPLPIGPLEQILVPETGVEPAKPSF